MIRVRRSPARKRTAAGLRSALHSRLGRLEAADMRAQKLTKAEIQTRLAGAKGWTVQKGKLHRAFECKDFVTAFGNMTRVALVAESMSHHPEWFNVWNKVIVDLATHSVNGISNLDFELAAKINEIFGA
jgi:4a-hydroxytetrahydrobiopterin dehydratase